MTDKDDVSHQDTTRLPFAAFHGPLIEFPVIDRLVAAGLAFASFEVIGS